MNYADKFEQNKVGTLWLKLSAEEQACIEKWALEFRFTHQDLRVACSIANELAMWKEKSLASLPLVATQKKQLFNEWRAHHKRCTESLKSYVTFGAQDKPKPQKPTVHSVEKDHLGLGWCPVASEKTRCCNLLTLDAVERCGFDCSYCSIQSFYHDNEIKVDEGFADKLKKLNLDPEKTYHIGTGQSSDSLMWGNLNGNLEALCDFARSHPNVILELKTKSKNIKWLLDNDVPANIICTWSMNPQVIVEAEEHMTASLEERIVAAERLAAKGVLVGFHFHPMIWYDNWKQDYTDIAKQLIQRFTPAQVALISMGTLTFSKSVLKTIRSREFSSKILQMPFVDTAGKVSYPENIKIDMFSALHQALGDWHQKVYFYLCMETLTVNEAVWGKDYADNKAFETDMKAHYFEKIEAINALNEQ